MACINPRGIPQSLLPQATSKKKKNDALGLLKAYSFVSEQAVDGLLGLHRLVHLATRNWMRNNNQFRQSIKTTIRLNEVFPGDNHTNRKLWREYLPHTLSLMGESEFQNQQEKYINLMEKVGNCLWSDGRYNEAEVLQVQVMESSKQMLGPEHPGTLASMHDLAFTYQAQGHYKKAEELQIQVIESRKQVLGLEHPDTLASMHNLVSTYHKQGQYKKAEELQIQVIKSRKQVLESEHPDTLASMHNLVSTYHKQGQYKKAEELQIQVIESRKQVLGPEHPGTLTSMNNLAHIWKLLGKENGALHLMDECVQLYNKQLGHKHPYTISSTTTLTKWHGMAGSLSINSSGAPEKPGSLERTLHISAEISTPMLSAGQPNHEPAPQPSEPVPRPV